VPTSSSARSCTTDKNGCRSVAEKEKAEVAIILSGILFSEDNFEPCREVLNAASYCGRCESRLKLVKTQFQVIERLRNQMAESLGKIVQSMVEHCEKILEDGPILPVIVHHKHELYESLDFMLEGMIYVENKILIAFLGEELQIVQIVQSNVSCFCLVSVVLRRGNNRWLRDRIHREDSDVSSSKIK